MKGTLFPCLRGVMGDWVYYSALMTAEQIAASITTAKSIREEEKLEDFLQRRLRDRVKKIARYLKSTQSRFFNAIIVGVFDSVPDWFEFDLKAMHGKRLDVSPVELGALHESMGLLRMTGKEKMFAIDGQHRTKAICDVWAEQKELPQAERVLASDQFPVVFVAHIDDLAGKKRTRRLFSDINKRAVPVSKGDLAIIDEDDICAIVARRLYAGYRRFRGLISLTEVSNLDPHDTEHFTNLLTLVKVNRKLKSLYRKRRGTSESDEVNVSALLSIAVSFYDFMIEHLPDLRSFFIDKSISLKALREKRLSLLFRPVGLVLIASLYQRLSARGVLDVLAQLGRKIDFALNGAHFDALMWNKGRMEVKHNRTALLLCLHLLGQLSRAETDSLGEQYSVATKDSRQLPRPLTK
ncbi:MAG: DGQHR domain-containing protein [Planctomycetes bacterium]|nr:DGQHR domain-containing protein [Planctomycetota bacterium]